MSEVSEILRTVNDIELAFHRRGYHLPDMLAEILIEKLEDK